jgi:hypothetical protein
MSEVTLMAKSRLRKDLRHALRITKNADENTILEMAAKGWISQKQIFFFSDSAQIDNLRERAIAGEEVSQWLCGALEAAAKAHDEGRERNACNLCNKIQRGYRWPCLLAISYWQEGEKHFSQVIKVCQPCCEEAGNEDELHRRAAMAMGAFGGKEPVEH